MPWNQTLTQMIMLVEDDPVHARIIRRALEGASRQDHLLHLSDGESAMAALFEDADITPLPSSVPGEMDRPLLPQLILLDLRLPAADGFDVLKAIREHPRTCHIPVIIVSTSERQSDIERCYTLGANAYITKPADYNLFTSRLRSLREFWLEAAELPSQEN